MSTRYVVRATRSDGREEKLGAYAHRDAACERARWLVGDRVAAIRWDNGAPPYIAAYVAKDGRIVDRFPAPVGEIPRFRA